MNKINKKKDIITKKEMYAITDAITGEMETAKVTIRVERNRPKYKEPFTMLFQAVNYSLLKRITPITAKLLLMLNSVADYDNIIYKTPAELAEDLNYSRMHVHRGMKQLEELNIIRKIPHKTDKRTFVIVLNAFQSWKGRPEERKKHIKANPNQMVLPFDTTIKADLYKKQIKAPDYD